MQPRLRCSPALIYVITLPLTNEKHRGRGCTCSPAPGAAPPRSAGCSRVLLPKNAWKTLGALLSPFFQSARAVALRRRLSLLKQPSAALSVTPTVRLRHSEKLRCFYLDAARTRLEKTSASHRDRVASIMSAHTALEITNLSAQKTRYVSGP